MKERGEIIGSGDIGSLLKEKGKGRPDRIFFVSGVSNSREVRESEYQREKDLLLEQERDKRLIYVSSLSVFYNKNRYTQHKREMEELIKEEFPQYTILRLGNITWGTNPNTLINHLRNKVEAGEPVKLQDTTRYIASEEEFLHWVDMIPDDWNVEMNITGQPMKVTEIFKKYVI